MFCLSRALIIKGTQYTFRKGNCKIVLLPCEVFSKGKELAPKASLLKRINSERKELATMASLLKSDLPGNKRICSLWEQILLFLGQSLFRKVANSFVINVDPGSEGRQSGSKSFSFTVDPFSEGTWCAAK